MFITVIDNPLRDRLFWRLFAFKFIIPLQRNYAVKDPQPRRHRARYWTGIYKYNMNVCPRQSADNICYYNTGMNNSKSHTYYYTRSYELMGKCSTFTLLHTIMIIIITINIYRCDPILITWTVVHIHNLRQGARLMRRTGHLAIYQSMGILLEHKAGPH